MESTASYYIMYGDSNVLAIIPHLCMNGVLSLNSGGDDDNLGFISNHYHENTNNIYYSIME